MTAGNKNLKVSKSGVPVPQFYNCKTDNYEMTLGKKGAPFVPVKKDPEDNTPISVVAITGSDEYTAGYKLYIENTIPTGGTVTVKGTVEL